MTKKAQLTFEQQKKIIWRRVEGLREERRKAFKAHEERIKLYPPRFDCDRDGCEAAASIAGQIEALIQLGKELGLIDNEVNYLNYL